MQLVLLVHENLQVLQAFLDQTQHRLPYAITKVYLGIDQILSYQALIQQYQDAEERLERLKMLLSVFAELESLLSDPALAKLYLPLEQKWHFAIDQTGNLTVSQAVIYLFIEQVELLSQHLSTITAIQQQLQAIRKQKDEALFFKHFKPFFEAWTSLWLYFFDWHNPSANNAVENILKHLTQLHNQLMEAM